MLSQNHTVYYLLFNAPVPLTYIQVTLSVQSHTERQTDRHKDTERNIMNWVTFNQFRLCLLICLWRTAFFGLSSLRKVLRIFFLNTMSCYCCLYLLQIIDTSSELFTRVSPRLAATTLIRELQLPNFVAALKCTFLAANVNLLHSNNFSFAIKWEKVM